MRPTTISLPDCIDIRMMCCSNSQIKCTFYNNCWSHRKCAIAVGYMVMCCWCWCCRWFFFFCKDKRVRFAQCHVWWKIKRKILCNFKKNREKTSSIQVQKSSVVTWNVYCLCKPHAHRRTAMRLFALILSKYLRKCIDENVILIKIVTFFHKIVISRISKLILDSFHMNEIAKLFFLVCSYCHRANIMHI